MDIIKKETYKKCLYEILNSFCLSETETEFEEKCKQIEEKYGKGDVEKVAEALIAVLKEEM